ncbi:MAG: capsular biosynthesis protein, partial [Cyanobacteria bacterium J06632_22]
GLVHHEIDRQEPGYGDIARVLLRRLPWVVGAVVTAVGVSAIATHLQSPTYRSNLQLLVEPNVRPELDLNPDENGQPPSFSEVELDYVTQLNLMRSQQFIEQAIAQMQAQGNDICTGWESATDCLEAVQDALSLAQVMEDKTETRIFEAVYVGESPEQTQQFLSALQQVYLDYNLQAQEQRVEDGLALVNQQITEVRQRLGGSQQALEDFRQGADVIDPEQQALAVTAALNTLVETQQAVQADAEATAAQYDAIQAALALDPQTARVATKLSQSGRYQQLLNELQATELALAERQAVYTEADPKAEDLNAQREQQLALLREEMTRVLGNTTLAQQAEETLLQEGQLGDIDLALVSDLVATEAELRGLQARQQSLVAAEQRLQADLDRYPDLIADYDRLQPEVETQRTSLEQLLALRQQLSNDLAQGGFKWAVVEAPRPGQQISPVPKQNLLMGGIVGLFLGGVLAFSRELIDTVVHTSDDLKQQAALPLLGVLPEVPTGAVQRPMVLPFWRDIERPETPSTAPAMIQWAPFRESVDLIYKNLQLTTGKLGSVMVTSALPNEGKTTFALGLALSAARLHQRVLLIDADLRNPSLHQQLGHDNPQGLSTLLSGDASVRPVGISLGGILLDVLLGGPVPMDPVQLLSSSEMRSHLTRFEATYDLVVVDTAAVLGLVDALQVASLCQNVVMVSRLDKVTQADLSEATAALDRVNPVGIVANGYRGDIRRYGSAQTVPPAVKVEAN